MPNEKNISKAAAEPKQLEPAEHRARRMVSTKIPGTPIILVANTKAECRKLRAALESSLTRHMKDIPANFETRVRSSNTRRP
jgi:hypothetical protein